MLSATINPTRNTSERLGQTDFNIYNKFGGYRKGQKTKKLTHEQMIDIEENLPCPHNPDALSELYLKGENKLRMEE